jgi:hypothetical protein
LKSRQMGVSRALACIASRCMGWGLDERRGSGPLTPNSEGTCQPPGS